MTFRQCLKHWTYTNCPGFRGAFVYFGKRVYFPPGAEIFRAVCQQGIFEADIVRLLTRFVEPETVFFDVGANIGLMAVPVLQNCPGCRVVSFEPSPSSLPFLSRTARASGVGIRWIVVPKALAECPGQRDFHLHDPRRSLYESFSTIGSADGGGTIKVPVSTLDHEWGLLGQPRVSVIKIDVEGAEGLVLRGASEVLRVNRPHLVVEWHEKFLKSFGTPPESLLDLAERLNYRIFSVPAGIPINDLKTLQMQMILCSNFTLVP